MSVSSCRFFQQAMNNIKMLSQSSWETLYEPCAGLGISRQVTYTWSYFQRGKALNAAVPCGAGSRFPALFRATLNVCGSWGGGFQPFYLVAGYSTLFPL